MKHFQTRGRLRNLPLPARIVYSVFLAFTVVALLFTAWLAEDMVGLDLAGLDAYYAGAEAPRPDIGADPDGPVLDLPPEADAPAVEDPMPLRKLLEVTHFHLFSLPVYLLILSHLFMLSDLNTSAKIAWISVSSVSTALHIAAPWAARVGDAHAVYGISGAGLALGFGIMTLAPLWDMWGPSPKRD